MSTHILGLHVNPNGGVPKHPVDALEITKKGCVGDKQNDLKHHGGPQKAVCIMLDSVLQLLKELGHPIGPGTTGENVLLNGIESDGIDTGSILSFTNGVVLEITGPAPPCKTIRSSFLDNEFTALSHKLISGQTRWYASVITPGTVVLGEEAQVVNESEQVESP